MSRKVFIIVSSTVVLGAAGFLLYSRAKSKAEIDEILSFIDNDRTVNFEKDQQGEALIKTTFNTDILKKPIPKDKKGLTMTTHDLATIAVNIKIILDKLPNTKWETYIDTVSGLFTSLPNTDKIYLQKLVFELNKIKNRYSLVAMNEGFKAISKGTSLMDVMMQKPFLYNKINGVVSKFGFVIDGWNPYLRNYFSTLPDYSNK